MLIVFLLSPFEGIDMIDEIDVTSFMMWVLDCGTKNPTTNFMY